MVTVVETLADGLVDTKLISQYQLHPMWGFKRPSGTVFASVITNIKSNTLFLTDSPDSCGVCPGQSVSTLGRYKHENKYNHNKRLFYSYSYI